MIAAKGYAAQTPKSKLATWNFERREVGPHDVQINIQYCGVCHSDLHQVNDDWFPGIFPMVPGHEIVGTIVKVGSHVKKFKAGDLAGVGCMVDSCQVCDNCQADLEQYCDEGSTFTYNAKDRNDQSPTYGGYSTNIVVREEFVVRVSNKLDLAATAPLLCAGITTYSPLRHWKVGKGHKLAVVGLGGLGHMAVKFGVAFGAEVTVLSTSADKEAAAKELGAHHFVVTKNAEQMNAVKNSFHFILDTVSADHDINTYLALLKTDGAMICVGIPNPYPVHPFSIINGRKVLTGSSIGGIKETQEMLDFCAEHNITSDIELIDIKNIDEAYQRMVKGDVRYRFVIDIATL